MNQLSGYHRRLSEKGLFPSSSGKIHHGFGSHCRKGARPVLAGSR